MTLPSALASRLVSALRSGVDAGGLPWESGGGGVPEPVNEDPPVITGVVCSGQLCAFDAAVWTGVAAGSVVYTLKVNGVTRAAGAASTIEAYTYTDADEEYNAILYAYPPGFPGAEVASDPQLISLPTERLAKYDPGAVSSMFVSRRDDLDFVLVDGVISEWLDVSGNDRDATQGTAANRPTPNATGINGMLAVQFDGTNDMVITAAHSLAGITAQVMGVCGSSTDTTESLFCERGSAGHTSTGGQNLAIRESNTTSIDTYAGGVAAGSYSHSRNNAIAPATPAVYVGTADRTLSSACTQTRTNGGGNVTTSRFADSDLNGDADNNAFKIGGRVGPTLMLTGFVASAWNVGNDTIDAGLLAQVDADVDLAMAWRGIA